MRRIFGISAASAGVVAAALAGALGLAACSHDVTAQDAVDTSTDVGSTAVDTYMDGVDALIDFGTDLGAAVNEGDLSAIESIGATRVVVRDAATGEELKTVTDQGAISAAFKGFSAKWGVAGKSDVADLTPEYTLELWQKETVKLGESGDRAAEVRASTLTTYRDSNLLTVSLGKGEALDGALSVNLAAPDAAALDGLRALAG